MSQIGTYTYNAVKVLSDDYTQSFASQIKEQPPLDEDEESFSHDVVSLFTSIPGK